MLSVSAGFHPRRCPQDSLLVLRTDEYATVTGSHLGYTTVFNLPASKGVRVHPRRASHTQGTLLHAGIDCKRKVNFFAR